MNCSSIRINRTTTIFLLFLIILVFYYGPSILNNNEIHRKVDLKKLLIGGIQVAVLGGHKVIEIYNSTKLNIRSKGLNDPVTEADFQSHCIMFYSLKRTFPEIHIVSEEQVEETVCPSPHTIDFNPSVLETDHVLPTEMISASDITVWIDPLDATQEFTEKLTLYVTTMVCVAVKGVPTIGIIHFPFTGVTSWAWVGRHVPSGRNKPIAKIVKVIVSRSHTGDVDSLVTKALGDDVKIIHAGGAGYKSLQVASGNASFYIHTTRIKKWDVCAGDAILRALGGSMTTLNGDLIEYGAETDVVNKKGIIAALEGQEHLLAKIGGSLPSI